MLAPDRLGDLGPVAGHHDDAVDPPGPQRPDGPGCVRADRVVHDQDPGGLAVHGDEHGQRPVQPGPPPRRLGPRCGPADSPMPHQAAFPMATRWPPTVPRMPWPATSSAPSGMPAAARGPGRRDHRIGKHVTGDLVQRCRQPEDFGGLQPARADGRRHRRVPAGQRPRLVQQQGCAPGELLEDPAALDDDAPPRGYRHPGHERDRGSQDQRARRGDHQDGHGPGAPPNAQVRAAVTSVIRTNHSAYRSASRTNGACDSSASRTRRTMPA